ncbi:MAG: aspartyl-tRNA(Asn)/glutamyl-tRNA(Gln) amidotransferase subunit [Actinomycetota bacterium]|jgi:aspartyl-tRNA(Asn)/glutamyl-tRNA(Gln) amidotransferase subunit A
MRTAIEIAEAIRAGELKATEILDESLRRIAEHNDALNAFVVVDEDAARVAAAAIDDAVAAGRDPGPFAGVPLGVKDLEDAKGLVTSHGSLLFKHSPPQPEDSIHMARLRAAGCVPLGKTAAPEFGTVAFTHTKAFGTTRNPWDLERTPGGSSGGSAAAVAAGLVPMATASDGGGSIRIPAAFSGLVGMKPSFGRIPHPFPAVSQTSVYGVEVTTVRDAARHLDVTAGPANVDRTTLPPPTVRYEDAIENLDVSGLRIAYSSDLGFGTVDPELAEIVEAAARDLFTALGRPFTAIELDLPDPVRTWLSAGAVEQWLSLDEGMWPDRAGDLMGFVRRGYEATENLNAQGVARRFRYRFALEAEWGRVFDEEADVIICPTTAVPAFPAAGPPPSIIAGKDVGPALTTPFCMPANLCWNPAISLPAGLTSDGLPVGLQINAPRHADEIALRLGRIFEQARPWPRHAPGYVS